MLAKTKTVKVRKNYKCAKCDKEIKKGDISVRMQFFPNKEVPFYKYFCVNCDSVNKRFNK